MLNNTCMYKSAEPCDYHFKVLVGFFIIYVLFFNVCLIIYFFVLFCFLNLRHSLDSLS